MENLSSYSISSLSDSLDPTSSASLLDLPPDDFYELCKSHIKFSDKNILLYQKHKAECSTLSLDSSHQLEVHLQQTSSKLRQSHNSEPTSISDVKSSLNPLSTLFLHIIRKKDLNILIPDFELYSCRELLAAGGTHECYFGLARLNTLEGQFDQALKLIDSALACKEDTIYRMWKYALTVLTIKKTQDKQHETYEPFWRKWVCCEPVKKENAVVGEIKAMSDSVEKWWSLMELSIRGIGELSPPQYYSGKIKELDNYYGYLAWSEVLFRRNEWQVALDIVKELIRVYGSRPEAYIKLWNHYYYIVKDYEQAEITASEAMLKVSSHETFNYYILFCIYSSRTLFKLKRHKECLEFLFKRFIENPTYPTFLFSYGKYCTKSEDYLLTGCAIGSLTESLRLCDSSKTGLIYFWLSKAYMLGRQHLEAYDSIRLCLQHIDPSLVRKIIQLQRWQTQIDPSASTIKSIESILLSKPFDTSSYAHCQALLSTVQDLHKLTVDVLSAKMSWKLGNVEEALNKLFAVSGISTVKMNAYYCLLRMLEEQKNLKCMNDVAYEMLVKCKNFQVPSQVWFKANLIYARVLVKNNKAGKAILVLKCLAKMLPPMPFSEIPYTKQLQRAASIQDLTTAHLCGKASVNAYTYSTYKSSFVLSASNVREFSQAVVAEDAAPLPALGFKNEEAKRHQRTKTGHNISSRQYGKRKSFFKVEEKIKETTLLGISLPNYEEYKDFSICSDPVFLYKIGKISSKTGVCLKDGVCAINDYLELLRYEKDGVLRELLKCKAVKVHKALDAKISQDEGWDNVIKQS